MTEPKDQRVQLTKDEQKEIVKQAIQEWLDLQFTKFGRWSFYGMVSGFFAMLLYLYLTAHGLKGM